MAYFKNSNRLLVIDDNKDIHEDFKKVLSPKSENLNELKQMLFGNIGDEKIDLPTYEIDTAMQGEEGILKIRKAQEDKKPYFAAFVDIRMPPGLDGIETIEKIWEIDDDVQTVICTAYSDYTWQDMIKKLGISDRLLILKKPFDSIEVRQLASSLSEKWQLIQQSRCQMEQLQTMVDERTAEIRATLEATTDGILVISQLNKIIDCNQNFVDIWENLKLIEAGVEEIMQKKDPALLLRFITENLVDPQRIRAVLEKMLYTFGEESLTDLRFELALKNNKTIELYCRPLWHRNYIVGKVLSFRDVTEQKYFEKQLAFQATHDLLTHLPNRALLSDRLEQAIVQSRRNKMLIAVIFLDLDRFKNVNDTLGHSFGDELLKELAKRLQSILRESDTLCRIGGDEFVLIIPDLKEANHATVTIQKIQAVLSETFVIKDNSLNITSSLGISFYPRNGNDAETLLKNADAAMYRAKALGKNTFQFYNEEMNAQMSERLLLEQNLYLAYKLGELLLFYQPIVDLQTGEITCSEALLRWQHPQIGLISPNKFIPIAEETGLILPIGEWVLRTACEQNAIWNQMGNKHRPVAINLSAHQVKNPDSFNLFSSILDTMHYDAKYLELELTENILMETSLKISEAMDQLHSKGVSFVIDDFGTGYSNLNYLLHYPISKLKIDKTFVENIDRKPAEIRIINAVISLAHSLKMRVVAEGVETWEQLEALKEAGCDEVQGFYLSPPLPALDYARLLQQGSFSFAKHPVKNLAGTE
jgi:diguanylate cyclase (GGDEF)-like protein